MTRLSRIVVKERVREAVDEVVQGYLDDYGMPTDTVELGDLADLVVDVVYELLTELDEGDVLNIPINPESEEERPPELEL